MITHTIPHAVTYDNAPGKHYVVVAISTPSKLSLEHKLLVRSVAGTGRSLVAYTEYSPDEFQRTFFKFSARARWQRFYAKLTDKANDLIGIEPHKMKFKGPTVFAIALNYDCKMFDEKGHYWSQVALNSEEGLCSALLHKSSGTA